MDDAGMFTPFTEEELTAAGKSSADASAVRKTPIIPVPANAPPYRFKHPKRGEPSISWPYHDANGDLVGYVARWDFLDENGKPDKEVLPVTFCQLDNGRRGWRSKGIPSPRPLFGLPEILARPDATVLIVEGEKTRDAAATLFPDVVVTTPAHGSKSPHLTDFGSLAGRCIVIATDFDEPGRTDDKGRPHNPGRDFGDRVCALARDAGAASVQHLHPDDLARFVWRDGLKVERPDPIKDGWDLADARDEDGWTVEVVDPDLIAELPPYLDAAERRAESEEMGEEYPDDDRAGWGFRSVWNGVEKRIERTDKETGIVTVEWRWFCSQLEIAAETRSADGEEWGRELVVTDRDGRVKSWAMPMAMLAGDGTAYRERLLSLGLTMAPGKFARDALHEMISTARPEVKARCVNRVGWHLRTFVFANTSLEARR